MYDCGVILTREDVEIRLSQFAPHVIDADLASRLAAVCLLLVPGEDGEVSLVITRRASALRAHAGQWALPGGRIDEGETVTDAALRELEEEVGITIGPDRVLGQLDDYLTRSGYRMTPVIVWAADLPFVPAPHEAEVASVFRFGMSELDVDPKFLTIPESDRPVVQVPLGDGVIHAPTGAILHQFREVVLHGRTTRVAHFEQPVFAWK